MNVIADLPLKPKPAFPIGLHSLFHVHCRLRLLFLQDTLAGVNIHRSTAISLSYAISHQVKKVV